MKVDFVNWYGIVGPVLMQRMKEENDFAYILEVFLFTTLSVGDVTLDFGQAVKILLDASDATELAKMDIIVTCQGGDYIKSTFQPLRDSGWNGYWIDVTSSLRMKDDAIIVPDLVNRNIVDNDPKSNMKNYIGGNYTIPLVLIALGGLSQSDLVEWVTSMTYQAVSGVGARNMCELISGVGVIHVQVANESADPSSAILDTGRKVSNFLHSGDYPKANLGVSLVDSLIPWIDTGLGNGQSKEEWKGGVETNKILGRGDNPTTIDGLCVHIDSMRCHSQAITLKLKKDLSIPEIEAVLASTNDWVKIIPSEKEVNIRELAPVGVTGALSIPVGRTRKLGMGGEYIDAFTAGDQLLWSTTEPPRRVLRIVLGSL